MKIHRFSNYASLADPMLTKIYLQLGGEGGGGCGEDAGGGFGLCFPTTILYCTTCVFGFKWRKLSA